VREALEQLPAERANGSVDGGNPVGDLDRDSLEGVDLLLEAPFQVGTYVVVAAGDQAQQVSAGDDAAQPDSS
jgi:hypothetical protein